MPISMQLCYISTYIVEAPKILWFLFSFFLIISSNVNIWDLNMSSQNQTPNQLATLLAYIILESQQQNLKYLYD